MGRNLRVLRALRRVKVLRQFAGVRRSGYQKLAQAAQTLKHSNVKFAQNVILCKGAKKR
jgi:hypothetical protein